MINDIKNNIAISKLQQKEDSIKTQSNTTEIVMSENQKQKEEKIKQLEREIFELKVLIPYCKETGRYPECDENIPFYGTATASGVIGVFLANAFMSGERLKSPVKSTLGGIAILVASLGTGFGIFKYIMHQKDLKAEQKMKNELLQKEQELKKLKNGIAA